MKIFLPIAAAVLILWQSHFPAFARDFHSWLKDLREDAVEYGISKEVVDRALPDTLEPNERVLRFDQKQPEHHITFEKYKKNVITPKRISDGRQYMQQYHAVLKKIGDKYGVDPEYIVSLWGMETSFGKITGGFETIPALVTLAYDGRRSQFFKTELFKALKIIQDGDIGLHEMKGSWAGAMGQCQFMPSSFEKYARDYNKDGKRDIWNTREDVFASTAAYLSSEGWQKHQPFGRLVTLPKSFDNKLLGLKVLKPVKEWQNLGVKLINGKDLPPDACNLASIIQPGGEGYKTYIVYNNYRILMKWNYSVYFATAVGQFADLLKN